MAFALSYPETRHALSFMDALFSSTLQAEMIARLRCGPLIMVDFEQPPPLSFSKEATGL